jgi:hypothetical protein
MNFQDVFEEASHHHELPRFMRVRIDPHLALDRDIKLKYAGKLNLHPSTQHVVQQRPQSLFDASWSGNTVHLVRFCVGYFHY